MSHTQTKAGIPLKPMTKKLLIALRTHDAFLGFRHSWDTFFLSIIEYFEDLYEFEIDRGILERDNSYRFQNVKVALYSKRDFFKPKPKTQEKNDE